MGSIRGRVKNLTTDEVVPQQKVILYIYRNGAEEGNQNIVSDSDGAFEFSKLPVASTSPHQGQNGLSYKLTTNFQNADYSSQPILLTSERPEQTIEMNVYSSSGDDSKIQISAYHLIIEPLGNNREAPPQITEYIILKNTGNTSYLSLSQGGNQVGLKLELPHGFSNFKPMQGLMECCISFDGDNLLYSHATIPGMVTVAFTYQIPASKRVNLSRRLSFNTSKLFAFVAGEGSHLTSNMLSLSDKAEMQGKTYTRHTANDLTKGQTVDIQLELPYKRRFNPVWLSGLVLVVGLAAILVVRRLSGRGGDVSVDDNELTRSKAPQDGSRRVSSADLKKGYLELISRLDEMYEANEIGENAYKRIREEQKAKLSEVMGN